MPSLPRLRRRHGAPSRSRRADVRDDLPLEPSAPRRYRTRRGGPRTPLPLIMLIALGAGVGVAYVGQTAAATSATYQATALQSKQMQLEQQVSLLDDQLARMHSVENIIAAAEKLGMRPSAGWANVPATAAPVIAPPQVPEPTANPNGGPVQQLLASLGGVVGETTVSR